MIAIEEFKSFSLTKKARIVLDEGEYLGDTIDDLAVYSLYDFWAVVDEDFSINTKSYLAVKSIEVYDQKPYIHREGDEDIRLR